MSFVSSIRIYDKVFVNKSTVSQINTKCIRDKSLGNKYKNWNHYASSSGLQSDRGLLLCDFV